jgi:bacterioferritin
MTKSNTSKSIENLQTALSMELTAIQQYLLHTHVLDDWGLDRLAEKMREEMNEELGHAGRFIDRILFLEGMPKVEAAKAPVQAQGLDALFRADLGEERGVVQFYTQAAQDAAKDNDIGTARLFEDITIEEEGHVDWLTRQMRMLEKMGEPTYMLSQMEDPQAA